MNYGLLNNTLNKCEARPLSEIKKASISETQTILNFERYLLPVSDYGQFSRFCYIKA